MTLLFEEETWDGPNAISLSRMLDRNERLYSLRLAFVAWVIGSYQGKPEFLTMWTYEDFADSERYEILAVAEVIA